MKSVKIWLRLVLLTAILAAALAGCGEKKRGEAEPIGPQPVETKPPIAVAPQPGAKLAADIQMGDKASKASLLLTVSDDGTAITSVMTSFSDLKCEGFSAGYSMSTTTTMIPIENGKFSGEAEGEINGQFTSPTTAKGTIHLVDPECGTWDWSTGE